MKLKFILERIKIQKNLELFFVLLLILISIAITQIYNASREVSKKEYINYHDFMSNACQEEIIDIYTY